MGCVGEANFHLAFQFSCLDVMGITRDLGGVPALPATAKYQLLASFVILFTAGIIHNKQPAVLSEWDVGLINECRAARYSGSDLRRHRFGAADLDRSMGIRPADVLTLRGQEATRERILAEISALERRTAIQC
jgi:hypothetical protein